MKKITIIILSLFLCIACDDEEKAIETVLVEVDRGAVLRTLQFNNGEFEINNPSSVFSIDIEEQDIEEGRLLSTVDVFVTFIDNTPAGNSVSTQRILLETLTPEDFATSDFSLPAITLDYTYAELLDATGLTIDQTNCKDQFRLDLDLNLSDGLTFNVTNSAGTVVNTTGFFKSPFTYLINIVEPISSDKFTGVYQYTSIEDGLFGPSFGPDRLFTIVNGHSNNFRQFEFGSGVNRVLIEFSIVCDAAVVTRYQKLAFTCTGANAFADPSDRVLIGPDIIPATIDPNDDTVFELHFLEAFEGFDAFCDYANFPSKVRFSKQ
ncbi:hypothetical protein GCM10011344_46400 [Dokdonia pacifica]|uniref:Uncharacterized protein n=1 Tax=Dokdonia pacifica TaxID=1627892 RepID=A0A239D9Y5_9FLAO|nr:hypothetical protein [Dokdonia pacifica]GGG40254.1 hypothetical protein GCM10011344_46400 [Dokdonia pacifica]SNS29077.1 hypothetical protein SAMN06265376_11062 [Dokdonia pacifica]